MMLKPKLTDLVIIYTSLRKPNLVVVVNNTSYITPPRLYLLEVIAEYGELHTNSWSVSSGNGGEASQ